MGYYFAQCTRLHLSAQARPSTRAFLKGLAEGTLVRDEYHNPIVPSHLAIEDEDGVERDWDRFCVDGAVYLHWNDRTFVSQPDGSAIVVLGGSGKRNTAEYFLPFLTVLQPDLVLSAGQVLMHIAGEDSGYGKMIAAKQTDDGLVLEVAEGLRYETDHDYVTDGRHPKYDSSTSADLVWTVEEVLAWNKETGVRITERQESQNMGYWLNQPMDATASELDCTLDSIATENVTAPADTGKNALVDSMFTPGLFDKVALHTLSGAKSTLASSLMLARIHHCTMLERPVEEIAKGKKGFALTYAIFEKVVYDLNKKFGHKSTAEQIQTAFMDMEAGSPKRV